MKSRPSIPWPRRYSQMAWAMAMMCASLNEPCSGEFIDLYGATEMAPLATALRHEETLLDGDLARSCGRAVAGVDLRIVDTNGYELPPGKTGEVVVRGPNIMPGYWNKPEETSAVLRDGWYHSGDLGFMNAQGYLFLVDRVKDMIISGGENVYSTEVEEVLYLHPAVLFLRGGSSASVLRLMSSVLSM